eukprot:9486655-Pyramimonas_sp.AAC.1
MEEASAVPRDRPERKADIVVATVGWGANHNWTAERWRALLSKIDRCVEDGHRYSAANGAARSIHGQRLIAGQNEVGDTATMFIPLADAKKAFGSA